MKSRAFGVVLLCLQINLIIFDFSTATEEPNPIVTDSPNGDEHNKLLVECQHPDYRTYIKCLKRHKRHHWHSEHDSEGGENKNKCFEECGIDHCESTKCVHDCHKRCMKKTKETRQIITQYETTCDSGDCKEESKSADLPTTNITTNIDINNVINNHMPKVETVIPTATPGGSGGSGSSGGSGGSGGSGIPGTPSTPGACTGSFPHCCGGTRCWGNGGWYGPNTGFSLVPQIQFVPQITFGLGASGFAGGGGAGYWPGQAGGVDCSPCGNPLLRYRCDVSCYGIQGTGYAMQNTERVVNSGCTSPHCVGGV